MATNILRGDEGMWLPNRLPLARLKKLYGFEPTPEWREHVQKASVRMNNGGSAAFVSPNGLLATNHHVAADILHDISSEKVNRLRDGFYAERIEDEIKSPNLEVNVLWEIEDVTERVLSTVKAGMTPSEAFEAKQKETAKIEKESYEATGLRSDVVVLYQGGRYHLYRYKKYNDVRLVFAPEEAIAGFGGDFDNFEFPRYCLDIAFFRVYENGKPLATDHFFRWSAKNPEEGELLFISGHPGHTDRLDTLARIISIRDLVLPYNLNLLRRREINLQQFSGRSEENKRRAHNELHRIQNTRKAFVGELAALQNPRFIEQKTSIEEELRKKIGEVAQMQKSYGDAWEMVEHAEAKAREIRDEANLLENKYAFNTELFTIARTIVRMSAEDKKPNDERLPEYRDSGRDSLLQELFSPAPIYKDLEEHKLADSLSFAAETLGFDQPLVKNILAGKSPQERAHELVASTKLDDVNERKRLADGGEKAILESQDPFIVLALLVDKKARAIRKIFESDVKEIREQAYAKIARAQFELYGEEIYPDATFTLRVAFGRVLGYSEQGAQVPAWTTIGEVFGHGEIHKNEFPWKLPESWQKNRAELEKSRTAFNFQSTHDTHGGNSGSPVFDKDLNYVGAHFDATLRTLGNTFMYADITGGLSVHSVGILEALKKVYRTERLIGELVP